MQRALQKLGAEFLPEFYHLSTNEARVLGNRVLSQATAEAPKAERDEMLQLMKSR